jgi:hypothetical protein
MKRLNSKFTQAQLQLIQAGDKKFRMYRAISFKYYETHREFVTGVPKISGSLLKNISKNLGLKNSAVAIPSDRVIRRFRTKLKQYFNSTSEQNYKKDLQIYLTSIISSEGIFEYEILKEHTVSFLERLGKPSVSALTVGRVIKSTLHQYEKELFSSIVRNLDNVTKAYLDGLLITYEGMSWMNHITRWIRGINANNIAFEAEKLQFLKRLSYPYILTTLTAKHLKRYYRNSADTFDDLSYDNARSSFTHYYRKIIVPILEVIEFDSDNKDLTEVLELIKTNINSYSQYYYASDQRIAFDRLIKKSHRKKILDNNRIKRIDLELCLLHKLRNKLRVKEVWIKDGYKYRNPEYDLPQDFDDNKDKYFSIMNRSQNADEFVLELKNSLKKSLLLLNSNLPKNPHVQILKKPRGHVKVAKLSQQEPPRRLELIKSEVFKRWPCTGLLDVLKETDLFVNFTGDFVASGSRISMSGEEIRKRLLLAILGYGTNTGLKSMSNSDISYQDLQYIKLRYLEPENIQSAIRKVVNSLLKIRFESLWGNHTTSVASDSKHFETSKQNLLSSWHPRYHSTGVMIYWHVDTSSVCIYSQLKSCTSSEVAAMLEGILKHATDAKIDKNYVDTHGASETGFAFACLFNFSLLPRYKNIHKQKLYYADAEDFKNHENLTDIMIRPINWELIRKHYEYIIKHAVALKLGMVDAEA